MNTGQVPWQKRNNSISFSFLRVGVSLSFASPTLISPLGDEETEREKSIEGRTKEDHFFDVKLSCSSRIFLMVAFCSPTGKGKTHLITPLL